MITEVKLAEVIDVDVFADSQQGDIYTIKVRTISDSIDRVYDNVRPLTSNLVQIPLRGEHVVIVKGLRQESDLSERKYDWYYIGTYSIQSKINNNLLPGVTTKIVKDNPGFRDVPVAALYPFIGDYFMQGRWGNTIRLGSSIDSNIEYNVNPTWSDIDTNTGNPIIILSNRPQTRRQYTTESINSDYSGLWLTSTQDLEFKLSSQLRQTNKFNSQCVAFADRIVLTSKTDVIALDGKTAIELNAPIISTGVSKNKEGILHSTVIIQALTELVGILSAGTAKGDSLLLASRLSSVLTKLNQAENLNFLQDKN
jgi:hypothetical protein